MGKSITHLSASRIARCVKSEELSPIEIVEAFLERIQKRNDRTNAFVTITDELAFDMAEQAQRQIDNGQQLGPLHGVPVAIKDLRDVKGVRTTAGSELYKTRIAEEDSPFVQRLKEAGAVILGKTNTPEFGMEIITDNRLVGPTGTPFDPNYIAGGSSGGAGAALADFLVPLADGSDMGGSIRIPASLCGVYGFKPTHGLIPKKDRPNAFGSHTPFSDIGPMARTVEDAARMMDTMAGQHKCDPFSVPHESSYQAATKQPIGSLKIAYSPDMSLFPVDPAVREVLNDAITVFDQTGASVDRVEPDWDHDRKEILGAYDTLSTVAGKEILDELENQDFDPRGDDRNRLHSPHLERYMDADDPTIHEYRQANIVRSDVFDEFQNIFSEYDLFISSTLSVKGFPHNEPPKVVDGTEIDPLGEWILTEPYNLTGHPAASIPAGFIDGLPIGMQIAGRRHADETVFAASAAFERLQPWYSKYPDS